MWTRSKHKNLAFRLRYGIMAFPYMVKLKQKRKDLSEDSTHPSIITLVYISFHHNYSHFWIDTNISFKRRKKEMEETIDIEMRDPEFPHDSLVSSLPTQTYI